MKVPTFFAFVLLASSAIAQQQPTLRVSDFTPELTASIPAADLTVIRDVVQKFEMSASSDCPSDMLVEVVRDAFQQAGYFKVQVRDVRCRVVSQTSSEHAVAVRAKADPGLQYRVGNVTFSQPTIFPASELRQQIPVAAGTVFDIQSIRAGLKNLRDLYCHQGYLDFTPVPVTDINEKEGTISIQFDVDEGAQYKTGQLVVEGTPSVPRAKERLLAAWKKYEGKPFDCTDTLKRFLHDVGARGDIDPNRLFKMDGNSQRHIVNVRIELATPLFAKD